MHAKLQPCLWIDADVEQAARFYAGIFPGTRIGALMRAPSDYPGGKAGDVLTVEIEMHGMAFILLRGGPQFRFSEAVSFQIATADQAETDRLWHAIVDNGGEESMCGWCKDRYGLSWQVTPKRLIELTTAGGDTAAKAFAAMMTMRRIDIAALERAVAG